MEPRRTWITGDAKELIRDLSMLIAGLSLFA
jgi:hypothetical protein